MNDSFKMKTSHQKNNPVALNTTDQATTETHSKTKEPALPDE